MSAEFLETKKIDTSKVKNMSMLFYYSNLKEINLDNWNTSNVIDMSMMFDGVLSLEKLNITNLNTKNVESMNSMFSNIGSIGVKNLDLSKWDTSNLRDISRMFTSNYSIEKINVSNWNTSKITKMEDAFSGTHNLKEIKGIENWDTLNVKTIRNMFAFSENLKSLNLSKWNTSNVVDMSTVFLGAESLAYLNIENWDTSKVEYFENIFSNTALTHIKIGNKFSKMKLLNNLFESLDEFNTSYDSNETIQLKYKWTRLDKTTPFYNIEDWNNVFRENPDKLAGMWVREKHFREDTKKIIDEKDKELKDEELINYTEPNYSNPDGITTDKTPIYKVKKITTTYKGDESLDKGQKVVDKDGKTDGNKVVRVGTKATVKVEKLPAPVRYEKDTTREKGQENITVKGKDGSKTTTTTYTVNPNTGEVVSNVGMPVVVEPTETVIKVAAKDKVEVVNKKDGDTIKIITSYEVNPKTGEMKEVKKEELLSKKGIPEVSEGTTDFKGGVNPTESIVREDLPELKVALIKDGDGNVLEVIKEDEKPKDIQGYKNTDKIETDKDGHKVYVYEKVEDKQDSTKDKKEDTDKPKEEEKVVNKDKEDKKEVISKKEELPKTSASMLSTVGLFSIFGLRKNRKKDKK